jgi:hypothetical protein
LKHKGLKNKQHHLGKEEIIIKVPPDVAEAYRNTTDEQREQMDAKVVAILKYSMRSRLSAIDKLRRTMDDISAEAQERGLTPEILESILNDD